MEIVCCCNNLTILDYFLGIVLGILILVATILIILMVKDIIKGD